MSELNVLIEQMVSVLSRQTFQLEELRLRLFLSWLIAHSDQVKTAIRMDLSPLQGADTEERFKSALKPWLESLPVQGILWEYHLILDEMAWWRDLDLHRLKMILRSETGM